MEELNLPLQVLFTRLQEAGIPLGVDEYQLLLKSLKAGFGVPDRPSLARLCKTLWVKSQEDQAIFDYHFEKLFGTNKRPPQPSKQPQYIDIKAWQDKINTTTQITEATNRYVRHGVIFSVLLGAVLPPLVMLFFWGSPEITNEIFEIPLFTRETSSSDERPPQTEDESLKSREENHWTWWDILLITLAAVGTLALARWVLKRIATQQNSENKVITDGRTGSSTENIQAIQDEVRLAQVIQQTSEDKHVPRVSYALKNSEYFPVTSRQLKQGWRYLRRSVREGPCTELDIEATVNQVGKQGMLMETVMVPPRVNKTELLILLDHDGSMVPFHGLSQRLADTALRAGKLGNAGVYYFHNCPVRYLFHDPNFQNPESINDFLFSTCSSKGTVLIFSDGGAARGGFNSQRLQLTANFLEHLRQQVKYAAWLNPLPQKRWKTTTAEEIANLIPMFEVSRKGFQSSIDVLRGRHQPEPQALKSLI